MPFEAALGTIALGVNDVSCTRHNSPVVFQGPLDTLHLDGMDPNVREAVFMLASFCFDLSRKMEYIYKAVAPYALHADPRLASEINRDNCTLRRAHHDGWESAARAGEEVIHRLWDDVHEHHAAMFRMVLALQRTMRGEEPTYEDCEDDTGGNGGTHPSS